MLATLTYETLLKMDTIFQRKKMELIFLELHGMMNKEKVKYEKVHSCKCSKEIWDTFSLAYEGNKSQERLVIESELDQPSKIKLK
ncbi:hypothetical protein CR513_49810, partial [Mucuna pruriens]